MNLTEQEVLRLMMQEVHSSYVASLRQPGEWTIREYAEANDMDYDHAYKEITKHLVKLGKVAKREGTNYWRFC